MRVYSLLVLCLLLTTSMLTLSAPVWAEMTVKYAPLPDSGDVEEQDAGKNVVKGMSAPGIAVQKPVGLEDGQNTLSASDAKKAQQMSEMYAKTLYQSKCLKRNARLTSTSNMSNKYPMTQQMLERACSCMTDNALKEFSASELVEYMAFTSGSSPLPKDEKGNLTPVPDSTYTENPETTTGEGTRTRPKFAKTTFSKIAIQLSDSQERKKCGFSK